MTTLTINELTTMLGWYLENTTQSIITKELKANAATYPNIVALQNTNNYAANNAYERLAFIVAHIKEFINECPDLAAKNNAILALSRVINDAKARPFDGRLQRVNELKAAITGTQENNNNWKSALFNPALVTKRTSALRAKRVQYAANANITEPVDGKDPHRFKTQQTEYSYAKIGNTWLTSDTEAAQEKSLEGDHSPKANLCSDAAYSQLLFNQNEGVTGLVLGVAGGTDHHIQDTRLADATTRVTYFTIKYLTRLMAAYNNAQELSRDLPSLIEMTRQAMENKESYRPLPKTTLSVARAFLLPDGQYQVVGVNVGDSSLYKYNPTTQVYNTLGYSRVSDQNVPATFPDRFTLPGDVQIFSGTCAEGSMILAMSKGVSDYLPHNQTASIVNVEERSQHVRDTVLTFTELPNPATPTAKQLVDNIADHALTSVEAARQRTTAEMQWLSSMATNLRWFIDTYLVINGQPVSQPISHFREHFNQLTASDSGYFRPAELAELQTIMGAAQSSEDLLQYFQDYITQLNQRHQNLQMGGDFTMMAVELPTADKRRELSDKYFTNNNDSPKPKIATPMKRTTSFASAAFNNKEKKSRIKTLGYTLSIGAAAFTAALLIGTGIALCTTGVFSPVGFVLKLAGLALAANIVLVVDIAICLTAGLLLGGATLLTGMGATSIASAIAAPSVKKSKGNNGVYKSIPAVPAKDHADAPNEEVVVDLSSYSSPTSAHHGTSATGSGCKVDTDTPPEFNTAPIVQLK